MDCWLVDMHGSQSDTRFFFVFFFFLVGSLFQILRNGRILLVSTSIVNLIEGC